MHQPHLMALVFAVVTTAPLAGEETQSNAKTGRILFVSDPSSVAIKLLPDPADEASLRRWVDMLADSGVDMFDQEIYSMGWTEYWRSDTIDYDQRIQHRRFLPMIEAGTQPVEVLIDQSHKRSMLFIAGFRVNDNHAYAAKRQGVRTAKFVNENRDLLLKGFPDEPYYKLSDPLDFTRPEPREFFHSVIEEAVRRFDVDGIELSFRDHGYFPHGTGHERKDLMTGLVRKIRGTVDKVGASRGKKLIVGARVRATLEECRFLGLDVSRWISERLIDYLSPQDVMYADFNVPYAEFAALTVGTDCRLYPGMLPWSSLRARVRLAQRPMTWSNQRALAMSMYAAGADGISTYNHFSTMAHPPFYPQQLRFLHVLGDPKRVAAGERHYVFEPTWAGERGFGVDKNSSGMVVAQKVVLDRKSPNAEGTYRFRLYEDPTRSFVTLLFRGFYMTAEDDVAVKLNGHTVDPGAIGRTGNHAAEPGQHVKRGGSTYRVNPEAGRIEFRKGTTGPLLHQPSPPFSSRWFDLRGLPVKRGANDLSVTLVRSDPKAEESIVIDEVDVWVQPTN